LAALACLRGDGGHQMLICLTMRILFAARDALETFVLTGSSSASIAAPISSCLKLDGTNSMSSRKWSFAIMLEVYAFSTPNSVRVPVALEEMGLEYELKPVNVRKGEQKDPTYRALNPNGKVPVLIDPSGPDGKRFVLTESSAILVYLAEKTGKLLPSKGEARARVFEQIFFHVTGIGPAFGQAGYFQKQAPEQIPHALTRFNTEAARVMAVFDGDPAFVEIRSQ
jgi:Glutathione S-transferase, N-terminal domain